MCNTKRDMTWTNKEYKSGNNRDEASKHVNSEYREEDIQPYIPIAAVCEALVAQEQFEKMGCSILKEYSDVSAPIPHLDELPKDMYC